ncbi:hypothetical protein B0J15DRAFT_537775 [Fusarium solani]|uniref:Uncharacterized protein n=1 Tax=Fusarium solani TaxID=169388 RepID=A0A9P9GSC3_FUSSL|nr:uncharacterized protein B0J15DRAFT_537775 [Fusarium solani]KAH7243830.1 hypothetical protein B0J15DRAFT_537775 [Fusarium solani]
MVQARGNGREVLEMRWRGTRVREYIPRVQDAITDSYAPVRVGVQDIARPLVDTALTRRRNLYRTGVGIYLESNLVDQCDSVWQLLTGKARQPADLRQEYNRKEARGRVDVEVRMCRPGRSADRSPQSFKFPFSVVKLQIAMIAMLFSASHGIRIKAVNGSLSSYSSHSFDCYGLHSLKSPSSFSSKSYWPPPLVHHPSLHDTSASPIAVSPSTPTA